jgi:hypothetical protein
MGQKRFKAEQIIRMLRKSSVSLPIFKIIFKVQSYIENYSGNSKYFICLI